jgi:hypothetical protein
MGFARICFFDGALWRRFGNEDLFFFFCSSRPMMSDSVCLYEAKIGIGLVAVQTFDYGDATQNCPTLIRSGSKSWRASPSLSVQPYRHVPGKRPHTRSNSWRRHGSHHHLTQSKTHSTMISRQNRTLVCLSVFLAAWAWNVSAAAVKGETGTRVGALTVGEIETQLQVRCISLHYEHSILHSIRTSSPLRC